MHFVFTDPCTSNLRKGLLWLCRVLWWWWLWYFNICDLFACLLRLALCAMWRGPFPTCAATKTRPQSLRWSASAFQHCALFSTTQTVRCWPTPAGLSLTSQMEPTRRFKLSLIQVSWKRLYCSDHSCFFDCHLKQKIVILNVMISVTARPASWPSLVVCQKLIMWFS